MLNPPASFHKLKRVIRVLMGVFSNSLHQEPMQTYTHYHSHMKCIPLSINISELIAFKIRP